MDEYFILAGENLEQTSCVEARYIAIHIGNGARQRKLRQFEKQVTLYFDTRRCILHWCHPLTKDAGLQGK